MSDFEFLTGRRAMPAGYDERTAPAGMRPVYAALAPKEGTRYGDLLPVAIDDDGTIRWPVLPNVMREGLLGFADLLSGTETGELTGRGVASMAMGGLGGGASMAPRSALAAGGKRMGRPVSDLALDEASRFARARKIGFEPRLKLYHGTDAPDFPAFAHGDGRAKSLGIPQYGFWAAEDPRYLEDVARLAGRPDGSGSRVLPLVPRFSKVASVDVPPGLTHHDIALNIPRIWGDGYDAIRFKNYNTFADGTPTPTWVFRHPNQLRSRFARFDPAMSESDDFLAGIAGPGIAPALPQGGGSRLQRAANDARRSHRLSRSPVGSPRMVSGRRRWSLT